MIPVLLTRIKTRDGISLEGIAVFPQRKSKTAVIWLHGLSSRFSSGQALIAELSASARKNNFGYFKFNTRGHDVASRAGNNFIGGGFERFEDCVHDIRAMIGCARKNGFTHIILAGHSTGANKALYYVSATNDRSVKGLLLLSAISDIIALQKNMGIKKFAAAHALAGKLRKHPAALMPRAYGLFSAKRFWSLCNPGEQEDTFPYYDEKRKWKALESIRIPIAVIIGSRDEYLDRTPANYLTAFKHHTHIATANTRLTNNFRGIIIKGANHGFHRKEKELTKEIIRFLRDFKK